MFVNITEDSSEVYTIPMLKSDVKKAIKYFVSCWFLLFSLGIAFFSEIFGAELIFNVIKDSETMLVIALVLVGLGYITISHDLKKIKVKQKKIKISQVAMIAVFLYMSMSAEVIFFVIDYVFRMAYASEVEIMVQEANRLGFFAQIASIAALFNYPIFFKGKEIWRWITIRDEKIRQYEERTNQV